MLTPQEITEKVFVKAVFGGYDMTGVDDFLEAVCADYTALYKENAILKGKLKVLVEKVEEYRSTEDSMRMALLTAQRLGEEITSDANKQKDEIIHKAEMDAKSKLAETAKRIADEDLRLSVAAKETAKFIELSQAIIRKHSEFLTKLETARRTVRPVSSSAAVSQTGGEPVQPPLSTAAPQPINAPEQSSGAPQPAISQGTMPNAASAAARDMHTPPSIADNPAGGDSIPSPDPSAATQPQPDEDDDTKLFMVDNGDSVTPRPKFDFEDLKFGSNFNPDE